MTLIPWVKLATVAAIVVTISSCAGQTGEMGATASTDVATAPPTSMPSATAVEDSYPSLNDPQEYKRYCDTLSPTGATSGGSAKSDFAGTDYSRKVATEPGPLSVFSTEQSVICGWGIANGPITALVAYGTLSDELRQSVTKAVNTEAHASYCSGTVAVGTTPGGHDYLQLADGCNAGTPSVWVFSNRHWAYSLVAAGFKPSQSELDVVENAPNFD